MMAGWLYNNIPSYVHYQLSLILPFKNLLRNKTRHEEICYCVRY